MNPPGDVPPPPPPGGNAPQPPSGGGGGNVDIGAAVSHGWNGFTQNIAPWIIAMLIVAAAGAVAYVFGFVVLLGLASRGGFFMSLIGYGLFVGLILVVSLVTSYGLYNGALQASRGETPTLQTMWDMAKFGNFAITVVLVGVITTIGFMLCWIPGIIAMFLLFLAPWLAIDQGLAPVDAMKASYERITKNFGGFFILWIVTMLVYYAGVIICGIGVLVSAPVALMTFAYGYRQLGLDRG